MGKNVVKKIMVMPLLAVALLLSACRYDIPEGYSKNAHPYEELVEFAKSIDPDATVTDEPQHELYEHRNYVIYPAKIGGIECSVATISVPVYDSSGEFAVMYYRMDTDYDFNLLCQILEKYPLLGAPLDDDLVARFNVGGFMRSCVTVDNMTEEKLNGIFDEFDKCQKELKSYSLRKNFRMQIRVGKKSYFFTETTDEAKQKVIDNMTKDGVLK
jgi:hypothetical protein